MKKPSLPKGPEAETIHRGNEKTWNVDRLPANSLCLTIMRYIGSNTWCLDKLLRVVVREAPGATSICDPFAGTCTVARYFKQKGFRVVTGDLLSLSFAFQVACVRLNRPPAFKKLFKHLGDHPLGEAGHEALRHLADSYKYASRRRAVEKQME